MYIKQNVALRAFHSDGSGCTLEAKVTGNLTCNFHSAKCISIKTLHHTLLDAKQRKRDSQYLLDLPSGLPSICLPCQSAAAAD